jgi:magnesium chelatase family protein
MDARALREHVLLDARCEEMLARTRERGLLSTRGQHRALRVARTIADLDDSPKVTPNHLATALALRPEAGLSSRRAA